MDLCPACFEVPPTTPPAERERILMDLARQGAADPVVRATAAGLYAALALRLGRAPTTPELVQWLMGCVHLLADYVPDAPGREVFQTVLWTVAGGCGFGDSPVTGARKGCGDCEDLAALLVALCLALGVDARVRWLDQPGAPLNHVTAEALWRGRWRFADATIPGARFDEDPYAALARVGPGFRSRVFGVEDAARGVLAPAGDLFLLPDNPAPPPGAPVAAGPRANLSALSLRAPAETPAAAATGEYPRVVAANVQMFPAPREILIPASTPGSTDIVALARQAAELGRFADEQRAAAAAVRAEAAGFASRRASIAAQFPGYESYLGFAVNPDGSTTPASGYAPNVGHFMLVPTSEEAAAVSIHNGDRFGYSGGGVGVIADRPPAVQTLLQYVGGDAAAYAARWVQLLALFADTLDIRYAEARAAAAERAAERAELAKSAVTARVEALGRPAAVGTPVGDAPPPPPPAPRSTLRTLGMVPYWTIYLDGQAAANGRWDGDAWVVDAPAGSRALRIVPPPGNTAPARATTVSVPEGREAVVSFSQVPEEGAPAVGPAAGRGLIVVRGAPAGVTPARVVLSGGTGGDPAQSQPLTQQPGGYLAVSWPVGALSRLQVGAFDVPATATALGDTVYDYTPGGLVFRPEVTSAAASPLPTPLPAEAQYTPSAVYRAVSLTVAGEGVTTAQGTPMVASERVGSVGVSLPGGPVREPPRSTVWTAQVRPGRYILRAEAEGQPPREGVVDVPASAAGATFAFGDADVRWVAPTTGTLVVTGVPGSTQSAFGRGAVGDALASGSRYVVAARVGDQTFPLRQAVDDLAPIGMRAGPDVPPPPARYSAALPPGRYAVQVAVESAVGRSMPTLRVVRSAEAAVTAGGVTEVDFGSMIAAPGDSAAAEEVASSFERERAAQFAAGRSGIVSTDATGLRNGYLSNISQRALPGVRRVVREFEQLGPVGPDGRAPFALLYRGVKQPDADGMFAVPMTPDEARKTLEWLAFLGRKRPDAQGYYPGDIHV